MCLFGGPIVRVYSLGFLERLQSQDIERSTPKIRTEDTGVLYLFCLGVGSFLIVSGYQSLVPFSDKGGPL